MPGTVATAAGLSRTAALVLALASLGACRRAPEGPLDDREHDVVVLVFVTPDCPISNRYAPELVRIAAEMPPERVAWWLVYPDPDLDDAAIAAHREAYALPFPSVLDPAHALVARASARVTPEVAVFVRGDDDARTLAYHGRIDDRYPEFGRARPEPRERDLQAALTAVLEGGTPPRDSAPAVGCPIADLL